MQENTETKSFVMYDSFFEATEQMSMDEAAIGKFVMLLRAYAIKGEDNLCQDGRVNALLALAKPLISASIKRYKSAVRGGRTRDKGRKTSIW